MAGGWRVGSVKNKKNTGLARKYKIKRSQVEFGLYIYIICMYVQVGGFIQRV